MNLLIITVYILIEAIVIIAKTERLFVTNSPATIHPNELVRFISTTTTTTTTTARPSPPRPTPYYPESKESLYNYNYNTTDIQVQEEGYINNVGTDQETLEARGSYNYSDNDGNTFQVSYIANKDGFQPEGAHLPIVPLIKKALRYIAEHSKGNGKE